MNEDEPRDELAEDDQDKSMSFLEHIEEARVVIFQCLAAFLVAVALILSLLSVFADVLTWPLTQAMEGRDDALKGLFTTGPMGVFSVILQLGILGGLILSLPLNLFFISRFIAPGLTAREKKVIIPVCLIALLMFLGGATFSYFLLMPATLKASVFFNDMLNFETIWTADAYYGLLTWMLLGVGLSFEFPLLILLIVYLGFVSTQQLAHYRPHAIVGFLGLSAMVTPTTDPITFLILATPLAILYEISIIVGRVIEKKGENVEAQA